METKIKKNQTADVGKYSYKYTDLAQIHDYLESINSRYIQKVERIDGNDYIFTKRCFDDKWEDEWIQGCRIVDATLVGVKNPAQEQGSAISYARRYSILLCYGLCTEDDDAQSLSIPKEITMEEAKNYTMPFGKHKGKKIEELPENYVDWLVGNSKDESLLKMIEIITGKHPMSEDEIEAFANLQIEFVKLASELERKDKYFNRESIYDNYGTTQLNADEYKASIEEMKERLEGLDE